MNKDWQAFDLPAEIENQKSSGNPYHEFLRVPSLSCGVYSLPVGAKDLQGPHDEDEVYLVIEGKGRMIVDGVEKSVGQGSILHVRATAEHSFFEVEEDLTLLVFFASGGPGKP